MSNESCINVVVPVLNEEKMLSKMTSYFNVLKQNAEKFAYGRVLIAHLPLCHNWEKFLG